MSRDEYIRFLNRTSASYAYTICTHPPTLSSIPRTTEPYLLGGTGLGRWEGLPLTSWDAENTFSYEAFVFIIAGAIKGCRIQSAGGSREAYILDGGGTDFVGGCSSPSPHGHITLLICLYVPERRGLSKNSHFHRPLGIPGSARISTGLTSLTCLTRRRPSHLIQGQYYERP